MFMFYLPILVVLCCNFVNAFDFLVSSPTSCGQVDFSWVGGTPPFRAIILVPDGTLRNVSIPDSAFNGEVGQFSTLLALRGGQKVLFSMEDATGPITGGTTEVMTVGQADAGSQSCNTTDPGTQFVFSVNGNLAQCKPYPFTFYSGAVQPITVLVSVPHGESFLLRPPIGDSFEWVANLTAGTSVLLSMSDSQGRIGGTSPVLVIGSSDDSSCARTLPSSSAPTRSIPTPTSSGISSSNTSGGSGSGNSNNSRGSTSSSTGLIIGAAAGGAVALIIICLLIWFFSRKRRNFKKDGKSVIDLTFDPNGQHGAESSFLLPNTEQHQPHPYINPFVPYSDVPYTTQGHGIPVSNGGNIPIAMNGLGVGAGAGAMAGVSATSTAVAQNHQIGANLNLQEKMNTTTIPQNTRMSAKRLEAMTSQQTLLATGTGTTNTSYPSTSSRYSQYSADSQAQAQFGMATGSGSSSNYGSSAVPTTSSSKKPGIQRPPNTQPRFILHTDIEDTVPEEPIELPPQYSESRVPLVGMPPAVSPNPSTGFT